MYCLILSAILPLLQGTPQSGMELQNIRAVYGWALPERAPLVYYTQEDYILFRFDVVGIGLKKHKQPSLDVEMRLIDPNGTLAHFVRFPNEFDSWNSNKPFCCYAYMEIPSILTP